MLVDACLIGLATVLDAPLANKLTNSSSMSGSFTSNQIASDLLNIKNVFNVFLVILIFFQIRSKYLNLKF